MSVSIPSVDIRRKSTAAGSYFDGDLSADANGTFGPEEIKAMTAAYEAALIDLRVVNREDPFTKIVATAIVTVTSMGERDPTIIKNRALSAIGASVNSSAA